MSAEHYVVKKVGDKYIPVLQEQIGAGVLWTVAGGLLIGAGFLRRGLHGWAASLIGLGFIYRGVTGRNMMTQLLCSRNSQRGERGQGPSYARDLHNRAQQRPHDEVEEASMESFPASDPPSHKISS
ncbi:MAG TPA: hypothetical protein VGF52_02740 [Tepidisphaeraceae bacterium]